VKRLSEFIQLSKSKGQHWFDADTMRFFKTRVCRSSYDCISGLFITSERGPLGAERRYSIRKADFETGKVSTVGEFQAYATLKQAKGALRRLQRGES
jgi:hypothetical protein